MSGRKLKGRFSTEEFTNQKLNQIQIIVQFMVKYGKIEGQSERGAIEGPLFWALFGIFVFGPYQAFLFLAPIRPFCFWPLFGPYVFGLTLYAALSFSAKHWIRSFGQYSFLLFGQFSLTFFTFGLSLLNSHNIWPKDMSRIHYVESSKA